MHHRVAALIAKKDNPVKKNKKQKIQFENYKIAKGISLKIINAKVEKAKVDIYGNFVYKIDNESHYEVGVEMDFSKSKDLDIKGYKKDKNDEEDEKSWIIQELIEPFSNVIKRITQEEEARKQNLIANKYNKASNKLLTSIELDDKLDVNVGKICEIEYKIGFKIDAKIKFQINFPSLHKQRTLIEKDSDSIRETLNAIETIYKNISFERINYEKLQELFLDNNIYFFVDPSFPPTQPNEITMEIPTDKNVNYPEKETTLAVHWRRITSLLPSSKGEIYNENDISPLDVIYGFKQNAKIMCILSHLAENLMFIKRILPNNEINPLGIYYVKFFVDGNWESVTIDGFIPCFLFSHPLYTYSQNSGWVMLVEKALAKYFNGYENLNKQEVEDIYKLLTGFPVNHIKYDEDAQVTTQHSMSLQDSTGKMNFASNNPVSNQEKLIDDFFSKLEIISNDGYLMCAYSDYPTHKQFKKYDVYFKQGFYYPIVAAVKLSYFKMIVVRNIWSDVEFQGEFYMNASKLPQKMLRYLEKYQDRTLMTMTPAEFVKFFNNVVVIQSKNYYELSLRSSFMRCQDSIETELENFLSYLHYEITVEELSDLKIHLSTINDSYFDEKYHSEKLDMSIGILTKDDLKNWQKIYYKEFEFEKDIIAEVQLPPGKYYLIPLTMGYCMRKNKNCYTTNPNLYFQDGTLNHDVIDRISQQLFYLYDPYCNGVIGKKDITNIYDRLNLQITDDDKFYADFIKKYCTHSDGITLRGLKAFMREIFSYTRPNICIENLRTLGYDKHLYPYLHRFYFIKFYSANEVVIRPKINIGQNLERILNNLFLQEIESDKKGKASELNSVSYKSTNGFYYIEGARNSSRRERKEVIFDASQSVNLFASTNVLKYSKFIDLNNTEFFMYLVIDNLIEPYVKSKPKQGETNEKDAENVVAQPNIMRSTISVSNAAKDKFDHKRIIILDSIPLMKNYII